MIKNKDELWKKNKLKGCFETFHKKAWKSIKKKREREKEKYEKTTYPKPERSWAHALLGDF